MPRTMAVSCDWVVIACGWPRLSHDSVDLLHMCIYMWCQCIRVGCWSARVCVCAHLFCLNGLTYFGIAFVCKLSRYCYLFHIFWQYCVRTNGRGQRTGREYPNFTHKHRRTPMWMGNFIESRLLGAHQRSCIIGRRKKPPKRVKPF